MEENKLTRNHGLMENNRLTKGNAPLKVLMALMEMDIGGAETHVLELCKALQRMGLDIYVVSNGGSYEAELIENGIKHFKAPLHNKNLLNMVRSYRFLEKIIRENDIMLVHAHARIPGFLCGLLQKRLKFRFVTTVHGIYNTAAPYRLLTNWGEKTLAVSEDLKRYLMENYNMPEENIYRTINGVDTVKFSKGNNGRGSNGDSSGVHEGVHEELYEELQIQRGGRVIVNLSRMDSDMTAPTHALIDLAGELDSLYEKIDIVIVGGGDDLSNVKSHAESVNEQLNRNMIHVTGPRVDTNRFFRIADIFVGVSRSAQEAMATEVPVVLAGNQGYLGIFDENTLQAGIDTNFCCRGYQKVTKELIFGDLTRLLEMDAAERERIGAFGREIVKKNYSVERMAGDAAELYDLMRKPAKKTDVLISGYYGSNNHGDDALLKAITCDLRTLKPDIGIVVLSHRPKETERVYKVKAYHRFNFIKIFCLLRSTNLLLLGGGTLIQDLTSSQSLFYYLTVTKMAIWGGARVMLYANGIGPVRKAKNRKIAAKTLERVDLITLRDDASYNELKELGVVKPKCAVTADAAFGIGVKRASGTENILKNADVRVGTGKYICVALRSWKYLKDSFEREMIAFLDGVFDRYGYTPVFIPMQKAYDEEISRKVIAGLKNGGVLIENDFEMDEILNIIGGAEFVVGMRLHTLIYAAKIGTPVIGLVYDPKVRGMMDMFGLKYYADVAGFTADGLLKFAEDVTENRESISKKLLEEAAVLEKKAFENAECAFELINRNVF